MSVSARVRQGRVLRMLAGLWLALPCALLAGPRVVPASMVLVGGESLPFKVEGDGQGPWRWSLRPIGEALAQPLAGADRAPQVDAVRSFLVRAASDTDPARFGEAALTILPRRCFEHATGGTGGLKTFPFLLPGGSRRFPDRYCVRPDRAADPRVSNEMIITGWGQPLTFGWAGVEGAEAALLSYREGAAFRCLDVTGSARANLTPEGPMSSCSLEALRFCPQNQVWLSTLRHFCVGVRGVAVFAGEPTVASGGEAERGLREPLGVAALGGGLHAPGRFVVADPGSHRLHLLGRHGEGVGGWGLDGERGYRDGDPFEARFDGPSFVAVDRRSRGGDPWQGAYGFVVADAGNQVLRRVDEEGRVSTLAGWPGEAGFRDADDPRQALFSNPQGVVTDREGNVFVADQGNHAIRRIAPSGHVTTLAGDGVAGHRDGTGAQARFQRLAGLAQDLDGRLYVADGHAVRRVAPDGTVTTLLGDPGRPGFLDDWERGGAALGGVPCLREPGGLQVTGRHLVIADRGNHAVRDYDLTTGTLRTLAGDPGLPVTRCGLLRDGIQGPLDPCHAGVRSPRGVAICEAGDLYVTSGAGLVRLCSQGLTPGPQGATGPWLNLAAGPGAVIRNQALQVDFFVARPPGAPGSGQTVTFAVEWVNADGTLAERQEGSGLVDRMLGCAGRFTAPGEGFVKVRPARGVPSRPAGG